MAQILNLNQLNAEGYTGKKKEIVQDVWPDIYAARQNQNIILQGEVTAANEENVPGKGKTLCAVIQYGTARGLIPFEESGCQDKRQLENLVGQVVVFKVIGVLEEYNLFGASRKQALEQMAAKTWSEIKEGQIRTSVVRNVNIRKAKLDIGGINVTLPAEEMSHGWVSDVREILQIGDNIDVLVQEVDKENKKVKVSLKALLPDPWPGVMKRYRRGMDTVGRVTGIEKWGIFVNLEPGVDVLCDQKTKEMRPAVGEKVKIRITRIDPKQKTMRGYIKSRLGIR